MLRDGENLMHEGGTVINEIYKYYDEMKGYIDEELSDKLDGLRKDGYEFSLAEAANLAEAVLTHVKKVEFEGFPTNIFNEANRLAGCLVELDVLKGTGLYDKGVTNSNKADTALKLIKKVKSELVSLEQLRAEQTFGSEEYSGEEASKWLYIIRQKLGQEYLLNILEIHKYSGEYAKAAVEKIKTEGKDYNLVPLSQKYLDKQIDLLFRKTKEGGKWQDYTSKNVTEVILSTKLLIESALKDLEGRPEDVKEEYVLISKLMSEHLWVLANLYESRYPTGGAGGYY